MDSGEEGLIMLIISIRSVDKWPKGFTVRAYNSMIHNVTNCTYNVNAN